MKSLRNCSRLLTLLLLVVTVTSCAKETKYPLPDGIPENDIVFMPDANPTSASVDSVTLGFINPDGSNRQEYTFSFSGGTGGGRHFTQFASHPRWSTLGNELAFSIRDTAPNMRMIDSRGEMYGKTCLDINGANLTFDTNGYILVEIRKEDIVYETYKQRASSATIFIARYDLMSCQIVSVISFEAPNGFFFREISESSAGTLVMAYSDSEEKAEKILIYESDTTKISTFLGFHPSLNYKGDFLAYYSFDGTLTIKELQTGDERKITNVMSKHIESLMRDVSMPGWSPDGRWLVYNTPEGKIYKVNIETGENVYLTHGWTPDWR